MRRFVEALVAASISFACTPSSYVHLPYPETEGYEAMVLAFELEGTHRLHAIDLSAGPLRVLLDVALEDQPWTAHALLFKTSLGDLKLEAGELVEAAADERDVLRLEADLVARRDSTGMQTESWEVLGQAPERFAPLRLRNDDPFGFCPDVDLVQLSLSGVSNGVRIGIPLPDGRLLLGTTDLNPAGLSEGQSFHVLEHEGDELRARLVSAAAATAIRSMARDPSGALFGAADGGGLTRVSLHGTELSFEVVSQPGFQDFQPFWLHVGETFVVLMSGRGLVRSGTRTATSGIVWEPEPLYDFAHGGSFAVSAGAMVAVENGELWLAKSNSRTIVRLNLRDGRLEAPRLERGLEMEPAIGITTLTALDERWVLAGLSNGEIRKFDLELSTWESLGATGFSQPLYVITRTGRGFVFGGGTGLFNFYVDDGGYCPLEAAGYKGLRAPMTAVRFLVPFGAGFLAVGSSVAGASQAVGWIRPRW